jgi:hypothetical protein
MIPKSGYRFSDKIMLQQSTAACGVVALNLPRARSDQY